MLHHALRAATSKGATNLEFVGGVAVNAGFSDTPTLSLSSLTGGVASSPSAGDIVIVAVTFINGTNRDIECTTSGYTEIADLYANGTNDNQLGVFYKVLSTSETSVSFRLNSGSLPSSSLAAHVWRGQNASPFDATATTATSSTSAAPNPASITTSTANAVVVAVGSFSNANQLTLTAAPSGMENFFAPPQAVRGVGFASIERPSAGSYDPGAFTVTGTISGATSNAVTIALRSS